MAEFDYTETLWDFRQDQYERVFIARREWLTNVCDLCGKTYRHFWVSLADWARTGERRHMKLCLDCYFATIAR